MKRKHSQDLRTPIQETGFLENLSVTMRFIIKTPFLDSSPYSFFLLPEAVPEPFDYAQDKLRLRAFFLLICTDRSTID